MDMGLKGKVALVTGGGRDVGREVSLALAAEGAKVAVNYNRSADDAEAVAAEITGSGGEARAYQCDVTDYPSVQAMVAGIVGDLGSVDVLVNNAGFVIPRIFTETTPDDWKRQVDIGLYGVIHCCHAVAPHMIAQKSGRIVNVTGDSARVGEKFLSITAASRGGVLSLTKSLARELGPSGINVNCVAFGLVATDHTNQDWLKKNYDKIVRQYPLGRIGKASDIAPAITFIASEGASWITGQILSINGGYAMVG
ncbi:MAG TPA: SDR family oxidoreductase [Alphaproteobacteria bacterium]|nr:SDR family oxidoreductase [Alphaproteobacteria bacterium]